MFTVYLLLGSTGEHMHIFNTSLITQPAPSFGGLYLFSNVGPQQSVLLVAGAMPRSLPTATCYLLTASLPCPAGGRPAELSRQDGPVPAILFPPGLLEAGRAVWKASVQSTGAQRCILLPVPHCLCTCPDSCQATCKDVARLSIMYPIGLTGLSREVCRCRTPFTC